MIDNTIRKEHIFNEDEALKLNDVANNDFTGSRTLNNNEELVERRPRSLHRIWLNNLPNGYSEHWHPEMEIIVPIDGYYDITYQGETHHLLPNNILIIPPRELHTIEASGNGNRFIYIMNINAIMDLRSFAGLQPILSSPLLLTPSTHPRIFNEIYSILVQIRSEYFNKNEFAELTIQALLLNMLIRIGENHNFERGLYADDQPKKNQKCMENLNTALEYIDENYTEDISLEFLAHYVGFSKYHFSRLFRQYTDYSFSDYLCLRRLNASEKLLEDPNYSIMEVALNSGFSSISTFNRIFKQRKGITPTEYRKMIGSRRNNWLRD